MKSMVLSNGLLNANLCPEVLQIPCGVFCIQDNSKKFGEKSSPHDLPQQEVTRRRPLSKLSLSCSVLSVPALSGFGLRLHARCFISDQTKYSTNAAQSREVNTCSSGAGVHAAPNVAYGHIRSVAYGRIRLDPHRLLQILGPAVIGNSSCGGRSCVIGSGGACGGRSCVIGSGRSCVIGSCVIGSGGWAAANLACCC